MCVLFLRLLCIFLTQILFPSVLVEKAQRKRGSSPSPAFGFLLLFSLLPADIGRNVVVALMLEEVGTSAHAPTQARSVLQAALQANGTL